MALTAGGTLAFYAYTTYMQKYLANTVGFDRATASRIMTAALFVFMLLQPLAGLLSDRVGRKPVMICVRAGGDAADGADLHRAGDGDAIAVDGVRAGDGEPGDRHRLHLDQRGGEGRAVPEPYPRARRGAALCASPTPCSAAPPNMSRLWLKDAGHERWFYYYVAGMIGRQPGRLCDDARDQDDQPDRRGSASWSRRGRCRGRTGRGGAIPRPTARAGPSCGRGGRGASSPARRPRDAWRRAPTASNGRLEHQPGLAAARPADGGGILPAVAEVERQVGAFGEVDLRIDQDARRADVAQADRVRLSSCHTITPFQIKGWRRSPRRAASNAGLGASARRGAKRRRESCGG